MAFKPTPLNYNAILEREDISKQIETFLQDFEANHKLVTFKKGVYIYGAPGSGKTQFALDILTRLGYDVIKYDAGDVRNKALIDTITSNSISSRNVLDMMNKRVKKIAILMDEIDGMNNGDKGGITSLIKLIRQKKTKKQRLENVTLNPIICIANYYADKKIRELTKVCNVYELKTPTPTQIAHLLQCKMGQLAQTPELYGKIQDYIQGDMRKLDFIEQVYRKSPAMLTGETFDRILQMKLHNEDSKKMTETLINAPIPLDEHNLFMNETDRTIVALLYHENIVDPIADMPKSRSFPFYLRILENMCYADYIDRITFQNQIWSFNEMSSLIKTFHNNKIYHDTFPEKGGQYKPSEVRFTKILTKYSTEYNNQLFLYNLSQELCMDKKDICALFQELRLVYDLHTNINNNEVMSAVEELFENYDINKLDIKRMYRYLDKNVKKEVLVLGDDEGDNDPFDSD